MNKVITALSLIAIVASAIAISMSLYVNKKVNNVVVVDAIVLFNNFEFKKELESRVEQEIDIYTSKIDSLGNVGERLLKANQKQKVKEIEEQIYYWTNTAQKAYEVSNKNINEQVWKRLNPIIDEFGKKNDYRLIIGANGMGTVLYNEDAVNVTNELIGFANSKYERGI